MTDVACECGKVAKTMFRKRGSRELVFQCDTCLPKNYRELACLKYSVTGFR